MFKRLAMAIAGILIVGAALHAQTIDDGLMIPKHTLFSSNLYSHDSWNQYWEGTLKRSNGNIGTLTTQTATWSANYGVTNHLDVVAIVPYVWTNASQGVLKGQHGLQNFTLAGKYNFLETPFTKFGSLRVIGVASGEIPLTNYTPDFQPLSIGLGSKNLSARATLFYLTRMGWFLNASGAYTWRSSVKLDRPFYYTNGQLYMTDEVAMPNVNDYEASAGYMKGRWMIPITYTSQRTLGGGDIRRQDLPFVSNRMNYTKLSGMVMFPVPRVKSMCLEVMYSHILDGRNVGYSSTISGGFLYTFQFGNQRPKL